MLHRHDYADGRNNSCTFFDLSDLINDFVEPYFLFIAQQITPFLSMKKFGLLSCRTPIASRPAPPISIILKEKL